jgi:hypothetical protein
MTFEASLTARSSNDYADFLMPHLASGFHLIDVGCGNGAISMRQAWIDWSRSPLAYAAFAWCRAVAWKSRA